MLRPSIHRPGEVFRDLIKSGPQILPGVFNAISALSAARAGATGLYLSGAGITNASLGLPDIALASLDEFSAVAGAVTSVVSVPVISDADTGFGEVHNVYRTVIQMERAGLAGIHLEDQVSPKRCGHLDGKSVIPTPEMVRKLRAASAARKDDSFVLIARTDARGVEGLPQAIERAKEYVDQGADVIFPEGLQSIAEFELFRAAVKGPLMANMTEFGKTPIIPASAFGEMGYEIVIYPMTAFRVMLRALDECYGTLLADGTQINLVDKMRTRSELYDTVEYQGYQDREQAWS